MSDGTEALRRAVIECALEMNASRVNQGRSGNVSARLTSNRYLITPTGMAYDSLLPEDIVEMNLDGRQSGSRAPSSEWRFHRDIYLRRSDVHAVVHAHPPFATALACHGRGIPPFHYMVAIAGGADVRCAPYATFGTQSLSDGALMALEGRKACLLAHHGIIAIAHDLRAALAIAVEVETLAQMYIHALALGEPPRLSAAEMDEVVSKFATYGEQRGTTDQTEKS